MIDISKGRYWDKGLNLLYDDDEKLIPKPERTDKAIKNTGRLAELEKEVELDKSIIHNQHELIKSGERRGEEKAKQRIAELEAQVENMKCCGNCGYWKRIGCRGVEPEHCCRNWKPG